MLSPFSSLRAIVNPFLEICLLRQGPQYLPSSGILLAIALISHTVASILMSNISLGTTTAVLSGVLGTLLLVLLPGTLLYVLRRNARIIQTVTALAGTGAIITFIALPLYGSMPGTEQGIDQGGFALLLLFILTVWSVAIVGHIFRHALSIPYFFGLLLAAGFSLFSFLVFKVLFPQGA
jgi:hypothetical protein